MFCNCIDRLHLQNTKISRFCCLFVTTLPLERLRFWAIPTRAALFHLAPVACRGILLSRLPQECSVRSTRPDVVCCLYRSGGIGIRVSKRLPGRVMPDNGRCRHCQDVRKCRRYEPSDVHDKGRCAAWWRRSHFLS